jgi:hypothetical protein
VRAKAYSNVWMSRAYEFETLSNGSVNVGLWAVGLRVGPALQYGRAAFTVVEAGVEVGVMTARPSGLDEQRSASSTWVAATAGSAVSVQLLGQLELEVAAAAVVPLNRTDFRVQDFGSVHRPDAVGGRLLLGLGWAPGGS